MRSRWFGLVVAALAAALSLWAYPRLPAVVATHWGASGQPNGYASRGFAVALLPLVMLGVTLLFQVLPKLDPRAQNYAKFTAAYWVIGNAVVVFLLAVHGFVIAYGLGYHANIGRLMPQAFGILFIVLGNYLSRVEPNWFVGIRTPWTLSSDTVWRETHRTGGFVFMLGGLVMIAESSLPAARATVALAVTIPVVVLVPIVQSYVLWRREQRGGP
jgi:uncharacterized membrane protein